jgi:hypothetical protein
MVLERVETGELVKALYESSNIVASTYNKNSKVLNIIFSSGGNYSYMNVKETDYLRFETAESQGQVFNKSIKNHEFLKHNKVDINETIKKIKQIKEDELRAMEVGIINLMKENLSYNEDTQSASRDLIYKVGDMINKYREMSK